MDFGLDISSILTGEEAEELFNEKAVEQEEKDTAEDPVNDPIENEEDPVDEAEIEEPQEEVNEEEKNTEKGAVKQQGDGTSPNAYSSIAKALKNDGIFSDVEDTEIDGVQSPDDFAELFEKAIEARLDEKMQRINSALNNGVQPDTIKLYEQTIEYLDSIDEDSLVAEGEDGENIRKQLIYNDLINKGFSPEKANRVIDNSFKSGSDIDDAKDALEGLRKFYADGYAKIQNDSKVKAEASRAAQKEQAEQFRKMVIDNEVKVGDSVLDKRTKQKIYDCVSKPVYKDPKTGQLLTEVQKFQQENPLEFLKQLGIWFVMTDGGKNTANLVKEQIKTEKHKNLRELERKINSSSFNSDGTLRYSGGTVAQDVLLSDDWKVG